MININGKKVASPSAFEVSIEDRGDFSAFNVLGQRLADRLAVKRIIDIEWEHLTEAELSGLLEMVTDGVFFSVEYPDPMDGGIRTADFRAVERRMQIYRIDSGAPVWTGLRMRWEER